MLLWILVIVLLVACLGGSPMLGFAPAGWGWGPSGGLGIVLLILVVLLVLGRI
jgi:hypothetical protein